tara:strand:+ start:2911 stop:3213 length:303 start_codon:yes stop_codon:yes gene_type:complete
VICQFLTGLNLPSRNYPYRINYDVAIAVRDARMINKSRQIAIDISIADIQMIDTETPNFTTRKVGSFSNGTFMTPNLFARIMKNSFVLIDVLDRKHTPPV